MKIVPVLIAVGVGYLAGKAMRPWKVDVASGAPCPPGYSRYGMPFGPDTCVANDHDWGGVRPL